MAGDKRRDRDPVRELQEDARWSAFSNETVRFRWQPRFRRPRGVGVLTVLLVSVIGVAVLVGAVALVMVGARTLFS